MKSIIEKGKKQKKLDSNEVKPAQIVEMSDDNNPGSVKSVNICKGTTVKDLKIQLGYHIDDDLLRGKNRQTLDNKMDLFDTIEANEKLVIIPNTEMGVF